MCETLLASFRDVRKHRPFRIGALVILYNHWHGLLQPRGEYAIGKIVGAIKQRSFHISFNRNERAVKWQKRFLDHRIRNEEDYYQHLEYMRLNPCKHRLVESAEEEWKYFFKQRNPFLLKGGESV